ncbi:MAG: AI-2E family transporter [Desulfohalobiaceae bacterium]
MQQRDISQNSQSPAFSSGKNGQEKASASGGREVQEGFRLDLNHSHLFLFLLLLAVLYGCYAMLKPFLDPIILAVILGTLLGPLQRKLEAKLWGRKNLAALISCLLLTFIVILPLVFVSLALIKQGINSFGDIYRWISQGRYEELYSLPLVEEAIQYFQNYWPDLQRLFPDLEAMEFRQVILQKTAAMGSFFVGQAGLALGNITALAGKFFLMIVIFYFVIRDEETLSAYILHLIPLSASQKQSIISKIEDITKSALLGNFVVAAVQGAAGGMAFWIVGLPGLFWGVMMAFSSLIPVVGTGLIWIPAGIYLLAAGKTVLAIFLLLWCTFVVGLVDNLLRPFFMRGGSKMSVLLLFLSLLGGIYYFGMIGLLYGPLLLGLALVLLLIYKSEFASFLDYQDKR